MDSQSKMYINGRFTSGQATERILVINPATEEVLGDVPRGTAADAAEAVPREPGLVPLLVHPGEGLVRHEDLPADLDRRGCPQ